MREQQTEGETDEMIALIKMIERQNDGQRERESDSERAREKSVS